MDVDCRRLRGLMGLLQRVFKAGRVIAIAMRASNKGPSNNFGCIRRCLIFIIPTSFRTGTLSFYNKGGEAPFRKLALDAFSGARHPGRACPVFVSRGNMFTNMKGSLRRRVSSNSCAKRGTSFPCSCSVTPRKGITI